MADIKTHLRELGVLVGIKNKLETLGYSDDTITVNEFCSVIDSILPSEKQAYYNNIRSISFGTSERSIIKNAFALAEVLISKLNLTELSSANWFGFDTGKDEPYDIEINGKFFSLKENSKILGNFGLYKLLNCYTGSNYKRMHIFENYANTEYCTWFDTTWKCLINYLNAHNNCWNYTSHIHPNKKAKITKTSNDIVLEYFDNKDKKHKISRLPLECTLYSFKAGTSKYTREDVFAKFINNELNSVESYNKSKKACAIVASEKLAKELNDNLNYYSGIARFLRIHKKSYYYAKTTSHGVELYEVPSESAFTSFIKIISIKGSVPDTQANILTTIENVKTKQKLTLHNECRFSHGQFNGTPEAKLYYENDATLDIIYSKI